MEVIIEGKRIQTDKATCLEGVGKRIMNTLSKGTPDIRRVIAALDSLGKVLTEDETFLVEELKELGLSIEEIKETKISSETVLSSKETFKKIKDIK